MVTTVSRDQISRNMVGPASRIVVSAGADSAESVLSCTIVVCTRNRPKELDRCLAAVRGISYPDFDVLVVDNAPEDGQTYDVARRWGVRYVAEPVRGVSRARNRGASDCATDIVAFLDDDAVPAPDWLRGLTQEFQDPLVMAVTGRILELQTPDKRDRRLCSCVYCPDVLGKRRRVLDQNIRGWFEMANFGGIGQGGNMAFRTSAFNIWPGFDERLGRGASIKGSEEHYAFFSLIDRGYRVVYSPRAIVYHPSPAGPDAFRKQHFQDLSASTAYFTFLYLEQPRYRHDVRRYVIEALRGVHREWRFACLAARHVPLTNKLLACSIGLFFYLQTCVKTALRARRQLSDPKVRPSRACARS